MSRNGQLRYRFHFSQFVWANRIFYEVSGGFVLDEAEKVDTLLISLSYSPFVDMIILMSASEPLFARKRTLLEFRNLFETGFTRFFEKIDNLCNAWHFCTSCV